MAKSIIQRKDGTCYLCNLLYHNDRQQSIETHHAFPGSRRKASGRYGLTVYLCPGHHTQSSEAVHRNNQNLLLIKQIAQRAFEAKHSHELFMKTFGKNYL